MPGVREHAGRGLGEIPRPALHVGEIRQVVQSDVHRAVGTRGEPTDHAVLPARDRGETRIDVVHDVDHVALEPSAPGVRPLGVREVAAADPPVRVDKDHRPGTPHAQLVVKPHVHVGDVNEHARLTGRPVKQVEHREAPLRAVVRRQVGEVVGSATQRLGVKVDDHEAAASSPAEVHERRETAVETVVLGVAVGPSQAGGEHRCRHHNRSQPCRRPPHPPTLRLNVPDAGSARRALDLPREDAMRRM